MAIRSDPVGSVPGQPRTFTFKPKDAVTPEAFKAAFSVTHLAELCKGKTP